MNDIPSFAACDCVHAVPDLDAPALRAAASRVSASVTPEQWVYRESELDELWRLAGLSRRGADTAAQRASGQAVEDLVLQAHDRLGIEDDTAGAADLLRRAAQMMETTAWRHR